VVCVLDFWHAAEHVHGYARLRYGAGAAAWAGRAVGLMREEGGAALLGLLQKEELPAGCGEEVSESSKKTGGLASTRARGRVPPPTQTTRRYGSVSAWPRVYAPYRISPTT
jgi:hypothetical protein